jgi:hypothetical protein
MIKKISFLVFLSILTFSCAGEKTENFQETEEDCGCDDVDTTAIDQK